VTVSRIDENLALIRRFWQDLYARDFARVGAYFAEDGHYEDVPAPDAGAVGPAAVAARLRIGLESVALPFVSIHVIREGKIALWRDYWDMNTLMDAAPQWWVEHILREAAAQGLSGSSGATSTER
jgi:ketosteroid isomerase-like protein